MAKQTRTQRRVKAKHRAVKPRPVRPLDVAKADNHEARHEAKKLKRAAHARLLLDQAHDAALREDARRAGELTDAELGMDAAADFAVDAAREDGVFGR